jgi:hypothetical protein
MALDDLHRFAIRVALAAQNKRLLSFVKKGLFVKANAAIQSLRSNSPADLYFGCVREWRYPSHLVPALRAAGFSTIEIPITDTETMWRIDGIWNTLWHVRLLPSEKASHALVGIDRHPDSLQGTLCSRVQLSIDWFSADTRKAGIVMPYFIHPELRRFENEFPSMKSEHRPICIGFAGTIHDRKYRDSFSFPIMTRGDVFDALTSRFADRIAVLRTREEYNSNSWHTRSIIIVSVDNTDDTVAKHILRDREYPRFLGKCAFFLAPPGFCMPLAHNIIEAMFLGAVPITNYARYFYPPLQDGVNCLSFDTPEELYHAVDRALRMTAEDRALLRAGVDKYVATFLTTEAFGKRLRSELTKTNLIIVNDEGHSVDVWRARQQLSEAGQPHSSSGRG